MTYRAEVRFDDSARTAETYYDGVLTNRLTNVHRIDDCTGRYCIIHNPSDHPYRDWQLVWKNLDAWRVETGTGNVILDPDFEFYQKSLWGPEVECLSCKTVIRSKNRHDMVYCFCGDTYVDGGNVYTRIGGPGRVVSDASRND